MPGEVSRYGVPLLRPAWRIHDPPPSAPPPPRARTRRRPRPHAARLDAAARSVSLPRARRHLVEEIYLPLRRAKGTLIETLAAYFQHGSSLEGAARALFVHPNTVRYRLRQVADLTGYTPTMPRHAFTLEIALVLGRQSGRTDADPPETGTGSGWPARKFRAGQRILCRNPTKNAPAVSCTPEARRDPLTRQS